MEDQEGDWEDPQDEEDRKIQSLQHELAAVSSSEDKKVLWGIPVLLLLVLAHYLEPSLVPATAVIVVIPVGIFGGLAWVILGNIRRKRDILIRRGLKCPHCGFLPNTLNASGMYIAKKCLKCHASLKI